MAPGRGVIDLLGGLRLEPGEVTEAELVRVRLPLVHDHRAGHGTEAARDVVLVRVTLDDGSEGWGECSALTRPTYTAEHTAGAWLVLAQELVPALVAGRSGRVVGHPMARSAVTTAVTDVLLRRQGRSLVAALSAARQSDGPPATTLARTAVVGLGASVDDVLATVAGHLDDGVVMVKCKVTPAPLSLRAVYEVRRAWPDLALAVDWNQSADDDSLAALAGLDLAYVEQPGPAGDLVACALLAERAGAPVALDESIDGPGAFAAAVALGAGSVLNLKPARVGGLVASVDLLDAAAEAGWAVFVGGMLETGVGRAAALAVAAQRGVTLPTDLGPSDRYVDPDITEALMVDGAGRMVVPSGPGIGRTVDAEALAAVAVERMTFPAATDGVASLTADP